MSALAVAVQPPALGMAVSQPVAGVVVAASLSIGQSVNLVSSGSTNSRDRISVVRWRSLDSNVAIPSPVSTAGGRSAVVTGIGNGATIIVAQTASSSESFVVRVGTGAAPVQFASDTVRLTLPDNGRMPDRRSRYAISAFVSLNPAIVTVGVDGTLVPRAAGVTSVRATDLVGGTGDVQVRVTDGASQGPPSGTRVAMTLTRIAPGSGSVLVSTGIPLTPNLIPTPAGVAGVRLFVQGVEQSISVQALAGRHPDGSLQAVLVQFPYPVPTGAGLSADLYIGSTRTIGTLPAQTVNPGVPAAVLLPSDPNYLVTTNLVGPTRTVAQSSGISPMVAKYDQDFRPAADHLMSVYSDAWGENFYDRAQVYYAQWVRTGNPEYWVRGTRQAVNYRRDYVTANNWTSSPHWLSVDGLGEHYLLTGDDSSKYAIGALAENMRYFRERAKLGNVTDIEARILARAISAQLWGWRLQARGADAIATVPEITTFISNAFKYQKADGAFRFNWICGDAVFGSLAYMDGMLDETLIAAHTYLPPSAVRDSIPDVVRRNADFQWSQWDVVNEGVKYAPGCPPDPWNIGVAELNNLIVNSLAWTYAQTGDVRYRQYADILFDASVRHQYLIGSKQFNQQYTTSYRYFFYRSAR